jgi:hypothetical protein
MVGFVTPTQGPLMVLCAGIPLSELNGVMHAIDVAMWVNAPRVFQGRKPRS